MDIPFAADCRGVEECLIKRYGIAVVTRDIPDPLTGDLDGLEIHIDYAVTCEERLFLLVHLFGHTVQWNTDPNAFELGKQRTPPVEKELLPGILAYEKEAGGYGLSLLHEADAKGLDTWFSTYSACDQAYLINYYETGIKCDFRAFWPKAAPLLEPKTVPTFKPTRRSFRLDGVVI